MEDGGGGCVATVVSGDTEKNVLVTRCDMLSYLYLFSCRTLFIFLSFSLKLPASFLRLYPHPTPRHRHRHPGRWRMTTPWGSKTRRRARCCCLPTWQRNTLATTPASPRTVWGLPTPACCCFVSEHAQPVCAQVHAHADAAYTRMHAKPRVSEF